MEPKRGFGDAIKVASVEEEYRVIARTPCANCGNRLEAHKQTLVKDDATGRHYDLIEARCARCGRAREFLFDIKSFFGKRDAG